MPPFVGDRPAWLACLVGMGLLFSTVLARDDASAPAFQVGSRFQAELQRPVNLIRTNTTVREMLRRISEMHHIAILLDRRIDPDRVIDVQLTQTTLGDGLRQMAAQWDAVAAVVGSTLFIGPPEGMDRIRTLIQIHQQSARDPGPTAVRRRFELAQGQTFRWADLDRPIDLVERIAAKGELAMEDLDLLPHDLWAGGVMMDVSCLEALQLVLGQYELTLELSEEADSARIVPIAGPVTIERRHRPVGMTAEEALGRVQAELADIPVRTIGRELSVTGSAAVHDAVDQLIRPLPAGQDSGPVGQGPLRNRKFTLKAVRLSAIAILRTLEAQDATVEYDSAALKQVGIDLSQKVSFQVEQVSADAFFRELCTPLGLGFEIKGKTVRLFPSTSRDP